MQHTRGRWSDDRLGWSFLRIAAPRAVEQYSASANPTIGKTIDSKPVQVRLPIWHHLG
jgi:hypothetical protein